MRCICCDSALNDFEATRRSTVTGDFLDMCNKCVKGLGIATVDRGDLQSVSERSAIYEDPDYPDWGYLCAEDEHFSQEDEL